MFSKDSKFWSHEWHRHGTCAETLCPLLTNEHAFFFAVLALNKMYDLNVRRSACVFFGSAYLRTRTQPVLIGCVEMKSVRQ